MSCTLALYENLWKECFRDVRDSRPSHRRKFMYFSLNQNHNILLAINTKIKFFKEKIIFFTNISYFNIVLPIFRFFGF